MTRPFEYQELVERIRVAGKAPLNTRASGLAAEKAAVERVLVAKAY